MRFTGRRLVAPRSLQVLLWVALASLALGGCSGGLSESEVVSKLEGAGLTVEQLHENLITSKQRQRIEHDPASILSVNLSDADGNTQTLTLVGFDHDWQAQRAAEEGVPGFVVKNFFFVGVVTAPQIQALIEATLK